MKLHTNSSLTLKQRQQVKELYASGKHSKASLARRFATTSTTITKWVSRADPNDQSSAPKKHGRRVITAEFEQAVKAYRADPLTAHHGKVRIASELRSTFACSTPSNVYLVLKKLQINVAKAPARTPAHHLPVGKHRTQMDIQQLPAIEGGTGFSYKISIIHLSTRYKYSEIHDNYSSQTVAGVYERALSRLPPFL